MQLNPASDSSEMMDAGATKSSDESISNRAKVAIGVTAALFLAIGMFLGGRIFGGSAAPSPAPAPSPAAQDTPDEWRVDGRHQIVNLDQRLSTECDAAFQASGVTTAQTGVVMGKAAVAGTEDWCTAHDDSASFSTPLDDQVGSFVMTADFGRNGFCCQLDVAKEMAIAASRMTNGGCATQSVPGVNFVINGGDAFYEIGLQTTEDPHVDDSWRNIYLVHPELNKPWYGVLGNHDYMGSVDALVELTTADAQRPGGGQWKLGDPDLADTSKATVTRDSPPRDAAKRYFFHEEVFCDGSTGLFIYIDSSPYLPQYYHDIDQGWGVARDGYYGAEDGVRAVNNQDRQDQLDWLGNLLQRRGVHGTESQAAYVVVTGHHPMWVSSTNEERQLSLFTNDFHPILVQHQVHAYLSGHDHTMQHHQMDGVDYFVAGTGSKIGSVAEPIVGSRFSLSRPGFLLARVSPTYLDVQFVDYAGDYVYEVQIPQQKPATYGGFDSDIDTVTQNTYGPDSAVFPDPSGR